MLDGYIARGTLFEARLRVLSMKKASLFSGRLEAIIID
jgi:hypothetical protein